MSLKLNITADRARVLYKELGKVRCWLTGFEAGRNRANNIPGEDSLRQMQIALQEAYSKSKETPS